jgi:glycerol-3-phosphate dehydrogenase (NAD(P)+)
MSPSVQTQISVLGAGSWGTAVALALAYQGHSVLLWARDKHQTLEMQSHRCNVKYLPSQSFPDNLQVTSDLQLALNTKHLLIAVPSHAFLSLLEDIPQCPPQGLAWLTKGLEPLNHQLLSKLVQQRFGSEIPMAMISGPSFAKEVAAKKPTALVVAGNQNNLVRHWQELLHSNTTRVYTSLDLLGVQLCGAVKNVLAIACGISDGLEFGANSRAALITRGIAEMRELGIAMGADAETFQGLAGLGDLVLTCTDNQSRNRRFGLLIGKNYSLKQAQQEIQQVVEGLHNAKQVASLAKQYKIDMPICCAVHQVLEGQLSAAQAAQSLLARPLRF